MIKIPLSFSSPLPLTKWVQPWAPIFLTFKHMKLMWAFAPIPLPRNAFTRLLPPIGGSVLGPGPPAAADPSSPSCCPGCFLHSSNFSRSYIIVTLPSDAPAGSRRLSSCPVPGEYLAHSGRSETHCWVNKYLSEPGVRNCLSWEKSDGKTGLFQNKVYLFIHETKCTLSWQSMYLTRTQMPRSSLTIQNAL